MTGANILIPDSWIVLPRIENSSEKFDEDVKFIFF